MPGRAVGLLVLLTFLLFVIPLAAKAPQVRPMPKIGVLMLGSPPTSPDWKERVLFLQELRSLGWLEGRNVTVEYRWAQGGERQLYDLAVELVQLHVDVIVASATSAVQAVKQATSTIPIVMLYVDDPVAEGIIASLAQPGGNITGVGGFVSELSGKWLELLTEAVPEVTHIAVLVQPKNPMTAIMVRDVERVARTLGVQLHVVEGGSPAGSSAPLTRPFGKALAPCWSCRPSSSPRISIRNTSQPSRPRVGCQRSTGRGPLWRWVD